MEKKNLIIPLRVQLDPNLYNELKTRTNDGLINMSEMVRRIIREYINKEKEGKVA